MAKGESWWRRRRKAAAAGSAAAKTREKMAKRKQKAKIAESGW